MSTDRDVLGHGQYVPMYAATPFESTEEYEYHAYQILYGSRRRRCAYQSVIHLEGRIEKVEAAWSKLRFGPKIQSHQSYNAWVLDIMAMSGNAT